MYWTIETYKTENGNDVISEWIDSLENKAKLKVYRLIESLRIHGIQLKFPHVRPLGEKLFELRTEDSKGTYRIIYFAHTGKRFVLLNGFTKKQQITPKSELDLAEKRMKEYLERG